ncbi:hypothetical protein L218DRAFT_1036799 [Marasmius fiardii PR-910]|nr:hypothetical protein L218DRAFT_1036799 [Marasmius fiardii PR-910]
MSDRSAPEFTIPTHFDNPTRPCPEFTPTPFDTECPTGIPPVFNKDDYPPLDGESWKDHREQLQKEEDRVDTERMKAVYEADLENWEQEEELRQWKRADYIAHAQREVEERKREEQCRASAVADASTDTPASAENPDDMKLIADDPVFQEEEGQKTRKGKGKRKERSVETEWVVSKKNEESLRKMMEEGFSDVVISNETQMDMMEEKVDKMVSLLVENLEVQKQILTSLRKLRFDGVIVPPAKKKGSKSDKRLGPEEAEASKSLKKRKRGDDDDEEYEGESERE